MLLRVCIDQVDFMDEPVQPDGLRARVLVWAERSPGGRTAREAGRVLEAVLDRGELPRGEVDAMRARGKGRGRAGLSPR